ncbi:hypothetical protein ANCCEY_11045 [Ancylostoma ceylanicum]|uniref:Nuclear pore complex protein n=1 Tax=Ancylostoma ceylanicum TaxID=53326 RepID=A0A0D6LIX8_9BILA|nr:hypothetical protein ANCCEY_11045 [Ancylostoma ceylanicum]
MRVVVQFTPPTHYSTPNSGYVDKAVCEDLHAALSSLLSTEEDYDIWSALERIFHDYRNALGLLGSQAPAEELKHASGAYRCLRACVVENCLLQDYEDGRVLWRWCIDSAIESSGFSDLAYQVKDIKELSGVAKSDMKRMRNAKQLTADPDSMLSAADDPNFDKLIRVVFSLLRCGRFEEAIELCGGMGVPWMTLMIRTQQMLIDSTLVGADLTKQEKARLHYRKLTYQIMKKAVAETKYSMGIRMVFAALLGDLHFLLPLATSVEDRLWCYANAAVQARLNNALELDHPVFVPTSIEGIFEAITTVETPPYYVLMNYMMRGAWDEAIEWMHGYGKKVDKNSGTNLLSLYRFFGLIASVCRIMKYDHNDRFGRELVGHMIDVLLQKQLFSLIPFYAALLPKDEALKKIWDIMPLADSEKEASAVINECESLKLVDRLAMLVKNSSESEPSNFDDAAGVVIDEFNNHCLYLAAQAHCTTFAMECARAQAAAKKLAEEEEGGEWSQQGDLDWARSEQLRVLRERFYASILNMLLRDLGMCDDASAILDLLPVLADEDLDLYKNLSKQDLRRFLLDVHALAGHAME